MPAIIAWGTEEWALVATVVVALAGWIIEARKSRRERMEREALEAEMREIQRRGRAPFLRATYLHAPKFDERPNQILKPGETLNPLTLADAPAGVLLKLQLANDGETVRDAGDDWPQGHGLVTNFGDLASAHRCGDIVYPYDASKLGMPMRIRIHFETQDGLKLHQVYEFRHGVCELKRIDPA